MNVATAGVTQAQVEALPSHLVPQALPIAVRQISADVAGTTTDVLCQCFADQTLIVVSQMGKVGCLTQVTMQRRPSHFGGAAAFDMDDEAERYTVHETSQPGRQDAQSSAVQAVPLGFDGASLLGSCQQQRLFGTHPPGQRVLYDLYNVHIAARAQHALSASQTDAAQDPVLLSEKPVVVGLALRQRRQTQEVNLDGRDQDEGEEEDDDFDLLANDERQRFEGILKLVEQACRS